VPALLFGSISTLADTSELQRQAFNQAFAEHGLDWTWSREDYRELLTSNGGERRIAEQARSTGQTVDAAAVHASKSALFQKSLVDNGIEPRPGVAETVRAAREQGVSVALVTTTSPENVAALLTGLGDALGVADFDLVVTSSQVSTPKPDGAVYAFALEQLGEQAEHCVAIEDNVGGVASAVAAGVDCIAFPNENTAGHDFARAHHVVDRIDLSELSPLL
jgi:HAD superfamily hydrolase (TIGR01509 family)